MSVKTKKNNQKLSLNQMGDIAQQAGLVLMTAAATLGLVELSNHPNKIILPNQPILSPVAEHGGSDSSTLRREREEAGPHYVSYSAYQRTPGRSGRA